MSAETTFTSQRLAAAIDENRRLRAESEDFFATLGRRARHPERLRAGTMPARPAARVEIGSPTEQVQA